MKLQIVLTAAACLLGGLGHAAFAGAADPDAAQALLKKSNCLKCHAADKKKEGPSFKETAAKYKGKADAEAELVKFVTSSPKVKVDGKEETHEALKTRNEAEVRNAVQWILSR